MSTMYVYIWMHFVSFPSSFDVTKWFWPFFSEALLSGKPKKLMRRSVFLRL